MAFRQTTGLVESLLRLIASDGLLHLLVNRTRIKVDGCGSRRPRFRRLGVLLALSCDPVPRASIRAAQRLLPGHGSHHPPRQGAGQVTSRASNCPPGPCLTSNRGNLRTRSDSLADP